MSLRGEECRVPRESYLYLPDERRPRGGALAMTFELLCQVSSSVAFCHSRSGMASKIQETDPSGMTNVAAALGEQFYAAQVRDHTV